MTAVLKFGSWTAERLHAYSYMNMLVIKNNLKNIDITYA